MKIPLKTDTRSAFFLHNQQIICGLLFEIDLLVDLPFTLHESNCKVVLLISFERDCKYAIVTCRNKDLVSVLTSRVSSVKSLYKADTSLRRTAGAGPESVRFRES